MLFKSLINITVVININDESEQCIDIRHHKNIIIKGPEHLFIKHWNEVNLLYAKIKFIINNNLHTNKQQLSYKNKL